MKLGKWRAVHSLPSPLLRRRSPFRIALEIVLLVWLAVRVEIMHGGQVIQKEEYTDWRGNVALPADFFVAEKWSDVPHWHH